MQKQIKLKVTNEGKMLSSFVNKYLEERGTFSTGVCQYSFGFGINDAGKPNSAIDCEPPTRGGRNTANPLIRFPKSLHNSLPDNATTADVDHPD